MAELNLAPVDIAPKVTDDEDPIAKLLGFRSAASIVTPPAPVIGAPAPNPVIGAPAPSPTIAAPAPAPIINAPAPSPAIGPPAPTPIIAPVHIPVIGPPAPVYVPVAHNPAPAPVHHPVAHEVQPHVDEMVMIVKSHRNVGMHWHEPGQEFNVNRVAGSVEVVRKELVALGDQNAPHMFDIFVKSGEKDKQLGPLFEGKGRATMVYLSRS